MTTIADEVWIACAMLHCENRKRQSFKKEEIVGKIRLEFGSVKPAHDVHLSLNCIANKLPNPANYKLLYLCDDGSLRLFNEYTDKAHPERRGKVRPVKDELPQKYHYLLEYYDFAYLKNRTSDAIILEFETPMEHLNNARNSIRDGHISSAVRDCGTAFEWYLKKIADKNHVDLPEKPGCGTVVEELRRCEKISESDRDQYMFWVNMRNNCVHSIGKIPSRQDAEDFIDGVQDLIKKERLEDRNMIE